MAAPLLATTADLATLTGLPQSDPRLALAVRRASNRFLGETNRPALLVGSYQERQATDGGRTILLRAAPVVSVESVTFRTAEGSTAGPLDPAGFWLRDPEAGVLELLGNWGPGSVTIDYTAGFETVPGDVEDAVLEHAATVAMVLVHVAQESGGTTSQTIGKEATVGTTSKWNTAVRKYNLQERA